MIAVEISANFLAWRQDLISIIVVKLHVTNVMMKDVSTGVNNFEGN